MRKDVGVERPTTRQLTKPQLAKATELVALVRFHIKSLAGDDPSLRFAYNRKIAKELVYDERKKPAHRIRLKKEKRTQQKGLCARCGEPLPATYTVLDRLDTMQGYTPENTQLLCERCDRALQAERRYA